MFPSGVLLLDQPAGRRFVSSQCVTLSVFSHHLLEAFKVIIKFLLALRRGAARSILNLG